MTPVANVAQFIAEQRREGLELWSENGALRFKATAKILTPALMATLKANKEAILQWLNAQALDDAGSSAPMIEECFALSSSQSAIWMLQKFAPASPVYNTTLFLRLQRNVDPVQVAGVMHALLIRHPLLRTTFQEVEGGAQQNVHRSLPCNLGFVDAEHWSQNTLDHWLNLEADAPFDLAKDSLLRVKILQPTAMGPLMVVTVHHLVADLWALLLIANDIHQLMQKSLQNQPLMLPAPAYTYRDHVVQQQHLLQSDAGEVLWHYWKEQLAGAPCVLDFPTDYQRPPLMNFALHKQTLRLTADFSDQLRTFCRRQGVTSFVLVQAALQLFVHLHTGERDFLIGTPTVGRHAPGSEGVVGDFANPVVLRARIETASSVSALLQSVRETVLAAMQHDAFPYPELVQRLNPPRDPSRAPIFQIMFLWHQAQAESLHDTGWIAELMPQSGPRGTPYDVMLSISDLKSCFECHWAAPQSLFVPQSLRYFSEIFVSLLEMLLSDRVQCIDDVLTALSSRAATDRKPILDVSESWLTAFSPESVSGGVFIKNDRGSYGVVHQWGQICVGNTSDAVELPVIGRINGNHQLRYGYCMPGWGLWQNELVNLADILYREPLLLTCEWVLLARFLTPQETHNVIYVVTADKTVPQAFFAFPFVQDVVSLTCLPRKSAGELDIEGLLAIPVVNHAAVEALSSQIAVMHSATLRLDTQHASVCLRNFVAGSHAAHSANTMDEGELVSRPEAYAAGEPLHRLPTDAANLLEALKSTALRFPDRGIHYLDTHGEETHFLPYQVLLQEALLLKNALAGQGMRAGDIVIMQIVAPRHYHSAFWALLLLGAVPLTIANAERFSEQDPVAVKLRHVVSAFEKCRVLTDRAVDTLKRWLTTDCHVSALPILNDLLAEKNSATAHCTIPDMSAKGVAFLQLTSGSTGIPKAIQITHAGILHHIAAVRQYNAYSEVDVTLNWLPYDHVVPLLTTHIKDVVLGCDQIQLPTAAVLADPLLWLRLMDKWRVTHSWAPNFGFQLVVDAFRQARGVANFDLSRIKYLMNAGEQVLPPTVQAFNRYCQVFGLQPQAVQPAFGMAECCTCMTYQNYSQQSLALAVDPQEDSKTLQLNSNGKHVFVNLGGVVPGVEIRIADQHQRILKEGVIGLLQIRGPVVTPGYLNNLHANTEAFVGDGWFNSGDLGFLWQGQLYVTGREKEMIIVRGSNYYCHDIEYTATVAGVRPTCVAAVGVQTDSAAVEQLVLFYVANPLANPLANPGADLVSVEQAISQDVLKTYGIKPAYILPVSASEFYKTTSGKIQRSQFKARFLAGDYQSLTLAYDVRHQLNLLLPHAYTRSLMFSVMPPLPLAAITDNFAFIAPALRRDTLRSLPALANKPWHFLVDDINAKFPIMSGQRCLVALPEQPLDVLENPQITLNFIRMLLRECALQDTPPASLVFLSIEANAAALFILKPVMDALRSECAPCTLKHIVITDRNVSWPQLAQDASGITHDCSIEITAAGRRVPRLTPYQYSMPPGSFPTGSLPKESLPKESLPFQWKPDAVYVITGGTGALGQLLCQQLLKQHRCRLVLLERQTSMAQEKEQQQPRWDAIDESRLCRQFFSMQDPDSITRALQSGLQHFSVTAPQGVFHLAGQMALKSLVDCSALEVEAAIEAKFHLAQHLYQWLKVHAPACCFVQYSSINSFFGGQAAGLYGWANALQAAFTEQINQEGKLHAWTFHWSFWTGQGMASRLSPQQIAMAKNQGFIGIGEEEGHRLFHAMLTQPPGNYFVGCDANNVNVTPFLHLDTRVRQWVSTCHIEPGSKLAPSILAAQIVSTCLPGHRSRIGRRDIDIKLWQEKFPRDNAGNVLQEQLHYLSRQDSTQPATPPRDALDSELLALWKDCLPSPSSGIDDNFFDKGGHSVSAARLVARINRKFAVHWPVSTLFQHPTVAALADILNGQTQLSPENKMQGDSDRLQFRCLHPAIKRPLFVWVPPLLGNPGLYLPTMRRLNACSFAWQEGVSDPEDESLALLASRYLDASREAINATQGITLLGWSFGGALAFELAMQLLKWGVTVHRVILIDSAIRDAIPFDRLDENSLRLLFLQEAGLANHELLQTVDVSSTNWLQVMLAQWPEQTEQQLQRRYRRFCMKLKALHDYIPAGWAPTLFPVDYIKAHRNPFGTTTMGWQDYFTQFRIRTVDADHRQALHHRDTQHFLLDVTQTEKLNDQGETYAQHS